MEPKPGGPQKKEIDPTLDHKNTEKKIFKAAVIDATKLVEAQARDIGDHKMTESKEDRSKGWFKRTLSRIWKHNIAQEYYRHKEIAKAKGEILETGNLYAGEDGVSKEASDKARNAIIDRFTSEFGDEMLKEEERESKKPQNEQLNTQIKNLIKEYAKGSMTKEVFEAEQTRILQTVDKEYAKKGKMYADNLFIIATEVRDSIEHGTKMEEMDFDIQLTLGKAEQSLNTEAKQSTFEKMQNSKIGKYIMNEPVVAATCAAAYSIAKKIGTSALRSKTAAWLSFGGTAVLSGGLSAMKERARLERERGQHMREKTKGMTFTEEDMKRRQEMEKNDYERKSATSILADLETGFQEIKAGKWDQQKLTSLLATLTDLESRIKLGSQKNIDLVSYSHPAQVEQERMELDLKRAQLKTAIKKAEKDGVLDAFFTDGSKFDDYLKKQIEVQTGSFLSGPEGVEKKDQIFKKLKRSKAVKAFTKTVLIGATVGATVQEGMALFQSETDGIVEGSLKNLTTHLPDGSVKSFMTDHMGGLDKHATALEALRRTAFDDNPRVPFGTGHDFIIGTNHLSLPDGVEIVDHHNGTFDVIRDGEIISDNTHLTFNPDGSLSDASKEILARDDIFVDTTQIDTMHTEHITNSADDYLKNHPELGTHTVHRDLWYDNDTPKPIFDKNELKLWWGSNGNTGIDEHGNFVFNVKHMTEGGSYHDDMSVDAQEKIKMHGLKMIFSLSRDTQTHVIEVPIDEHGNALIEKDSALAKLMFENKDGHALFTGKYAEVVQTMDTKDGIEHVRMLATHVGAGRDGLDDIVTKGGIETINKLNVPDSWDYDVPFFIPVVPRRPLERGVYGKFNPNIIPEIPNKNKGNLTETDFIPYYYTSGYEASAERRDIWENSKSETLKNNPDAELDQSLEIQSYLEKQDKEYIGEINEISTDMGVMNPECRLSVCIPVAGHQEGESIYKTLENYTKQTADPKTFELVLFVNRPETDKQGNPILPDQTLSEILRFKKDYPEMNVKVAEKILPIEKANIGLIRKYLNDSVLMRSNTAGNQDLILVSNDADNKGLSPEYIKNFITKFDEHKEVDSMLGQLDWDPDSYVRNPLIHIGTRLFQYLEIQSRQKGWHIASSGANFAMRASIYSGIGGYTAGLRGGEDTDLGEKIKSARKKASTKVPLAFAGARVSRLYTSSRRAEKALKDGLAPIEQWNQGFSAFDDEVRKIKWEDLTNGINFNNQEEVEKFIEQLETVINRTISQTKRFGANSKDPTLQRALRLLGINFRVIDEETIKITNASKMLAGLKLYQADGLELMKSKTGN